MAPQLSARPRVEQVRRSALESRIVELDVAWLAPADLDAVDALARLQLAATRRGVRLRLHRPPSDLADLLRLVGLAEILASDEDGGPEARRPIETGEGSPADSADRA